MRSLFPIVVNLVFSLCLVGIIFIPLELNLPTRMLITFYIVSILILVLTFGLTYTIIDIRNILLDIDKNIKMKGHTTQYLSEHIIEDGSKENNNPENSVQKINEEGNIPGNENKLICPFCGADYSEYPYATACFNCHKFFDSDKNQPQK